MAHRPVGLATSITTSTISAATTSFAVQSNVIRVVSLGADVAVAIGTSEVPTATLADYMIPSGGSASLAVTRKSQRVVGITTGSTTKITCPEGTNMPFAVGDRVTLEGNTNENQYQTLINYAEVTAVDTTSSYDTGLFGTQLTVDVDTSGIVTAFYGADATLRGSVRVAAIANGGTGTLFVQQVQVSGVA